MSGPKQSNFEIDLGIRKALERQRKIALMAIKELRRVKMRCSEEKKRISKIRDNMLQYADRLILQSPKNGVVITNLVKDLKNNINKRFSDIIASDPGDDRESIEKFIESIKLETDNIKTDFEKSISEYEKNNTEILGDKKTQSDFETFGGDMKAYDKVETAAYEDVKFGSDARVEKLICEIRDMTDNIKEKNYKWAEPVIFSLENLMSSRKNFNEMNSDFIRIKNEYERLYEGFKSDMDDMENIMDTYAALCEMCGAEQEDIDIKEAERRIKAMEKNICENDELKYIEKCVNKSMSDLGYDIIQSTVYNNSRKMIYKYDNDTAVCVYTAGNGAVMLELASVGPGNFGEAEKERLVNKMWDFCDKYPRIKEELLKYGIHLKNETLQKPSKEFAKRIKIDGYNLSEKRVIHNEPTYKKMQ